MISPQTLADAVRDVTPRAVRLRQKLHSIPELLYEEHQTAAAIRAELQDLGIAYELGPADAPTATFAIIGDRSKPCVALRADIDALPITEETGLPYASTQIGCMHACGHDGHAAGLLGAAAVLKRVEAELPVCVLCFWQPAEENGGGAQRLVKAGLLDGGLGVKPQCVFGLHGWPSVPLGKVSTRHGAIMASVDNFRATFRGRGAHGAFPHLGRDPIMAVAEAIFCLQTIVSREIDPLESAVITVGIISGGTATNIIPDSAELQATVRALNPATRQQLQLAIRRRLGAIADAYEVTLELDWLDGYPPTVNDPEMADYVRDVARRVFGADGYIPAGAPCMGGEDFAYYLEKIPGCFIMLGLCAPGEKYPNVHQPRFNFNDDALPTAIRLLAELAIGRG